MCTWEQITDAILRHTNTSLGAVLVTAGFAAENTLSTVIGAAVALVSVAQSILNKLRARAERVQVVTSEFLETTGGPTAERLEVQTTDLPHARDTRDAEASGVQPPASSIQHPASSISSKVGVWFLVFGVCAFGAGCASHKSTVLERTDKNGETTRLTRSATRTLFDADTKLANNVVLQSSNSQSIAIGSLRQQASGSNAVQSLRIMLEMMEKLQGLP